MKTKQLFLIILLFLFVGCQMPSASAMNTGFYTEELSEEKQQRLSQTINISVIHELPQKLPIARLAVSENGMIALGFEAIDTKIIGIYTNDGNFQYGYEFSCPGDFGVEWDGNEILIYSVRGGIVYAVSLSGEVTCIRHAPYTKENEKYWRHSVSSAKHMVGETEYTLEKDLGILNIVAFSYSQLVVKQPDGTKTILYDVNTRYFCKVLMCVIGAAAMILIVIFGLVKNIIKSSGNTEPKADPNGESSYAKNLK